MLAASQQARGDADGRPLAIGTALHDKVFCLLCFNRGHAGTARLAGAISAKHPSFPKPLRFTPRYLLSAEVICFSYYRLALLLLRRST